MNGKIKVGDKVRVKAHTAYQHLSQGAVIDPMIEHDVQGFETTVTSIEGSGLYDENDVEELIYVVATNELFSREQIEKL